MLPIKQVRDGQRWPPLLKIEPAAEVVQPHFGRQTRLHAPQNVGPLVFQAKGFQQPIMHGLHDLTQAGPPPPQAFGPAMRTPLLWLGDHHRAIGPHPAGTDVLARKAGIGDVAVIQRMPSTGQAWLGLLPGGQHCLGQEMIPAVAWSQAKTRDRAHPRGRRSQPGGTHAGLASP